MDKNSNDSGSSDDYVTLSSALRLTPLTSAVEVWIPWPTIGERDGARPLSPTEIKAVRDGMDIEMGERRVDYIFSDFLAGPDSQLEGTVTVIVCENIGETVRFSRYLGHEKSPFTSEGEDGDKIEGSACACARVRYDGQNGLGEEGGEDSIVPPAPEGAELSEEDKKDIEDILFNEEDLPF